MPPLSLFFPIGAVFVVHDNIQPVLDPECQCDCVKCCLRADTPTAWPVFLEKACECVRCSPISEYGQIASLLIVSEKNPQVFLGKISKDRFGKQTFESYFEFE